MKYQIVKSISIPGNAGAGEKLKRSSVIICEQLCDADSHNGLNLPACLKLTLTFPTSEIAFSRISGLSLSR